MFPPWPINEMKFDYPEDLLYKAEYLNEATGRGSSYHDNIALHMTVTNQQGYWKKLASSLAAGNGEDSSDKNIDLRRYLVNEMGIFAIEKSGKNYIVSVDPKVYSNWLHEHSKQHDNKITNIKINFIKRKLSV